MSETPVDRWRHSHLFHQPYSSAERRTWFVILLTAVMMVFEVAGGVITNSMALLADGLHMSTHLAALSITVGTYWYARRHADDERFTFGTGKVGTLGGFASAIFLASVALVMVAESIGRLLTPLSIKFDEAIIVACIGLAVNLVSAILLHQDPSHRHHHGHGGDDQHHHHGGAVHEDHNLKGAYLHVLADAVTSLTAIIALFAGKLFGWVWMDPVMGIVGSLVIARWAYGLLCSSATILVDGQAHGHARGHIREAIETDPETRIADLHVWRVGVGHLAAIVCIVSENPRPTAYYKELLGNIHDLSHVTVEVIEAEEPVEVK
jgi:cation diffusion facilitator family transporter